MRYFQTWLLLLTAFMVVVSATNFIECLERIKQKPETSHGWRDNNGKAVLTSDATTAITYALCVKECGPDAEQASWAVFSQQFSAWLLPWLALISQLPFGSKDPYVNLQSVLLTVGSPALAAYSLVVTALNGRWIAHVFHPYRQHPRAPITVKVLSLLQQAPLRVTENLHLLRALVNLTENVQWWDEHKDWLEITHSWSIAAATSIAWVFIAYIFTVIDSLTEQVDKMVNANGQAVGSTWLWLLAIVVGWLQLSPKCDPTQLNNSFERANRLTFTPVGTPIEKGDPVNAINLCDDLPTLRRDEGRSPPIFNYARVFTWPQAVEQVLFAFKPFPSGSNSPASPSSQAVQSHQQDDLQLADDSNDLEPTTSIPLTDRTGSRAGPSTVTEGSSTIPQRTFLQCGRRTWERIIISSLIALLLQWSTTSAAVVVVWFTPTKGMGCRSLAYLCYGFASTTVWAALLFASILSRYSVTRVSQNSLSGQIAEGLSIFSRRFGKCLAAANAVSLVVICVMQFSSFFDRCYCNSSVLSLGDAAYNVITFLDSDRDGMRRAWGGGVVLSGLSTILFCGFVTLFVNPPFP